MTTYEVRKVKEPLYTSDDDTANEEHGTPTATSDRDLKEVVEGFETLTVTKRQPQRRRAVRRTYATTGKALKTG